MSDRIDIPPSSKELTEKAIREWMKATVKREYPLQGGVSGSPVKVVEAAISFSSLEHFDPNNMRFVIKLSTEESFIAERNNYRSIPEKVRKWFIKLEVPNAITDGHYFMVMPHLTEYEAISHWICNGNSDQMTTSLELATQAMCEVHSCLEGRGTSDKEQNFGRALSIYLYDIQQSYDKIQTEKSKNADSIRSICKDRIEANGIRIDPYKNCLKNLASSLEKISPEEVTWSHGDCHSRNIMIRLEKPDVKFIDYNRLSCQGDYVNDFGTLIADIETYNALSISRKFQYSLARDNDKKFSYQIPSFGNMKSATAFLDNKLKKTANDRSDKYESRLSLAKARYLLGMALKADDPDKAVIVYFEGLKSLNAALC